MGNPFKISVIVPVYNAGEKLISNIESLINQSIGNLEIIVVNDASTDNSGSVIDHLALLYSNIIPVHFEENKGVHEARLAGLKKSTAPWIGFMDADDFARPKMFETLYVSAINQKVDIVICGSDRVSEIRKVIAPKLRFKRSERVDKDVFERFCRFEFGTGMLWNKLFKRSVIEPWFDMSFPWRQSINEDLILNIGCFYKAKSIYLCKDVLHEYVLNQSSVTSTISKEKAFVNTYRAAALAITFYNELGEATILRVIDLYRTQLSWANYRIDSLDSIIGYNEDLKEAVELIFKVNPAYLALLTARQESLIVSARVAIRSLIQRCLP